MPAPSAVPAGYRRVDGPHGERIVALTNVAARLSSLLVSGSLHEVASRAGGKVFHGRGAAHELELGEYRVVVRHNRHGGALAAFTRDVFWRDGRTNIELAASERLRAAGVATPRVVAVVTYRAAFGFSRSDAATELVPDTRDLSDYLCDADPAARVRAIAGAGALLDKLAAAGALHEDLNAKNILLRQSGGALQPYVLDVDRVTFHAPHDPFVMRRNVGRLLRSARKWRRLHSARVTDAELAAWQARCTAPSTPPRPRPR